MIWNLSPRYHTFIDSRADTVYTDAMLNLYLQTYNAQPGWQGALRQYRIRAVLVEPGAPLVQVLRASGGWTTAYHDSTSILMIRQ